MGKGCFLVILILLGVGVGLYLADALGPDIPRAIGLAPSGRPTRAPARPVTPAPAAPQPTVADLDVQVEDAATAVADNQPFEVIVTEAEANARLGQSDAPPEVVATPLGQATVKNPRVRFTSGEAILESSAMIGAVETPLTVSFDVGVANARPSLTVKRVDLGGVPLPGAVRSQVQAAAQARLNSALGDLPANIDHVDVQEGRLVVSGSG